jgi:hypothetical protein
MNEEHIERLVSATRWLVERSPTGYADGDEVAHVAEVPTEKAVAYHAMREAERRGLLECESWKGSMGLPVFVRTPF